jgi:hypothetical protein
MNILKKLHDAYLYHLQYLEVYFHLLDGMIPIYWRGPLAKKNGFVVSSLTAGPIPSLTPLSVEVEVTTSLCG